MISFPGTILKICCILGMELVYTKNFWIDGRVYCHYAGLVCRVDLWLHLLAWIVGAGFAVSSVRSFSRSLVVSPVFSEPKIAEFPFKSTCNGGGYLRCMCRGGAVLHFLGEFGYAGEAFSLMTSGNLWFYLSMGEPIRDVGQYW